jgi:dolichol-phosphate mannosyltransferase
MAGVVIVVPTFDEKDNVRPMAAAVFSKMPDAHLLFVDDNSPDGTGKVEDELAAEDNRVHVLHREKKDGLGRAYIAGFKWALEKGYRLICEMDCDFSHDPADLPRLVKAAEECDLAIGSRYCGGIRVMNWPLSRLLLSTGAGIYVRLVTGMPVADPTGGFKCFRREVLEAIKLDEIRSNGYSFQIEMNHTAWRMGYRLREVPIVFGERRSGYSKMRAGIAAEAFGMVLKLLARNSFSRKPRAKKRNDD